jgi:hypothetical protein
MSVVELGLGINYRTENTPDMPVKLMQDLDWASIATKNGGVECSDGTGGVLCLVKTTLTTFAMSKGLCVAVK